MSFLDHTSRLILMINAIHLYFCPFTKVEESFNLQAMHDILFHRTNISEYDHLEFPGVVPRSFIGPLFISFFSIPGIIISNILGSDKFSAQFIVRSMLGIAVTYSFTKLKQTVSRLFGSTVSNFFLVITLSQFHFMFYMTRPLPNIMVLPLVLLAIRAWFGRQHKTFIWCSATAIIIFRAELAMFLGLLLLFELFYKRITIVKAIKLAFPAGIFAICLTVCVDSIFWKRLIWPEAEVFWFNTVLNKSGEWGTSPFMWYFYSALPRGLGSSVLLVPIALFIDVRARRFLAPALVFIFLFSFLPHKEMRFIIYVFPLFNIAAAMSCTKVWEKRKKSKFHIFLSLGMLAHIFINVSFSSLLLMIAKTNYPGGEALMKLHSLEANTTRVNVHIDVLSAQTGVSRFLEIEKNWRYNKTENLPPAGSVLLSFTHLLVEGRSKRSNTISPYLDTHDILDVIDGFSHLYFNYKSRPFVNIITKPQIFILRRKKMKVDRNKGRESVTTVRLPQVKSMKSK